MKRRLVLVGEGHGEITALPILARKILKEKDHDGLVFVDGEMIRAGGAHGLVRWDRERKLADCSKWNRMVAVAAKRPNTGAVLAVFDGDDPAFPAGSGRSFCAGQAARLMASAATESGAGKIFSLAVVFACVEFESWLVAGIGSMVGKSSMVPKGIKVPSGHPESHGKRWLESNMPGYRPTRDQSVLAGLLELEAVRAQNLRSFIRLEHAIEQILGALRAERSISTPT